MTTLLFYFAGVLGTLATSYGTGTFSEEFHQSYTLAAGGRLALENIDGDVHIAAWDRNEVKIDAVKRAPSPERLEDARIEVNTAGGVLSIRTRQETSGSAAVVDYRVMVPRTARLEQVKVVTGILEITGLKGQVRASSISGRIRTRGLAGDVRLSTVTGPLEAAFDELAPARSIFLSSVSGSIEVLLPGDAHADLQADTVSGGITSDLGEPPERGPLPDRHWRAALKGGGARIRVSSVNGSISLAPAWRGKRVKFL